MSPSNKVKSTFLKLLCLLASLIKAFVIKAHDALSGLRCISITLVFNFHK